MALVFTDSGALRRSGEDSMAAELDSRGLKGIAGYILIEDRDVKSEEKAKAAIERAGAVGVIAIIKDLAKMTSRDLRERGLAPGPGW